jgi:NADH-quinone oxidoreductase subunit N
VNGVVAAAAQVGYMRALLPELVLTLTAIVALLVDVFQRGDRIAPSSAAVRRVSVAGVLFAAAANVSLVGLGPAGPDALVALDGFRVAANFIILGATLLGLLFAFDYLRREGLEIGEFYALVLLASVGMMVLSGAQDLILVFLGLEMMSISVYVLTGFNREDPRSAEAGLKYFLIGAFASAFFIYGVALLYGATGTTHLIRIGSALAGGDAGLLVAGGAGLLVIGFGFKVAAVPFHAWAPDAYQGAPTPVTGYMATGVKTAAVLAFFRVLWVSLGGVPGLWHGVVWWLAVLTMAVPNLIALVQDDVKRMLAYSSVAHAGYLLVGVVAGGVLGRGAALFYLVVYTLMTLGAFAVVYVVAGKGDRHSHLADFRGLGWRRPWLGGALGVFLLSLAGFPPTGGFVGKLYLLRAAVQSGEGSLAVILVLTSLVAYYYYLRVVWKMYFEEAPQDVPSPDVTGRAFRLGAVVCVAGILVAGLIPGPAVRAAGRAALEGSAAAPSVSTGSPASRHDAADAAAPD